MPDAPSWLPVTGNAARGEVVLRRVMAAGRTTFRKYSYDRARVDDIVEEAGISHGAFYLYFRNKEDLLHQMAVECAARLRALTAELDALPRPINEADLRGWIDGFVAAYYDDGPVIRVWLDNRDADPLMQSLANDALGPLTRALAEIVDPSTAAAAGSDVAGFSLLSLLERLSSYFVDIDRNAITDTATRLMFAATTAPQPTRS